jgi:hypothetical protein
MLEKLHNLDTEGRFMLAFYGFISLVTSAMLVVALVGGALASLLLVVVALFIGIFVMFETLNHADD